MTEELSPQTVVSYTVKEVLDKQTDLLIGIDHKVDSKADRADLVDAVNTINQNMTAMQSTLAGHHDRLLSLEHWRSSNARMWAASGVLLLAISGLISGLVSAHVI